MGKAQKSLQNLGTDRVDYIPSQDWGIFLNLHVAKHSTAPQFSTAISSQTHTSNPIGLSRQKGNASSPTLSALCMCTRPRKLLGTMKNTRKAFFSFLERASQQTRFSSVYETRRKGTKAHFARLLIKWRKKSWIATRSQSEIICVLTY